MFTNDKTLFANLIAGLSQQEVAKKLGMSQGQISNWLNGKSTISEEAWIKILSKIRNISRRSARIELMRWRINDAEAALRNLDFTKKKDLLEEQKVTYGFEEDSKIDFLKIPHLGESKIKNLKTPFSSTKEFRMIHKKTLKEGKKYISLKATGITMQGAGVEQGDELIICLDCLPENGDVCVFSFKKRLIAGYFLKNKNKIEIGKSHKDYPPIDPKDTDFEIVGVVVLISRNITKK